MRYNPRYYTLDKIPEYRQQFIDIRLRRFLHEYKVTQIPKDSVKLLQYIKNSKLINIRYALVPNMSPKFDAQAKYYSKYNVFIVLLNESKVRKHYPFRRSSDRRLNFTLAHEIAHIFLDHLLIPNEIKTLSKIQIEDYEADEFAGRLLMPENKLLSCNFALPEKVATKFNVSDHSLWKRINNLKQLDLFKNQPFYICETCENRDISPVAQYCRICGSYLLSNNKGVVPLKYEGYQLDQNGHSLECPICKNEEYRDFKTEIQEGYREDVVITILPEYCRICGSMVINRCTNKSCKETAHGNSRYCEFCGSQTTFYVEGYLPHWDNDIGREATKQPTKNEISHRDEWEDLGNSNIDEIPF